MKQGEVIKATAYQLESVGIPGQWVRDDYLKAIGWALQLATVQLYLTVVDLPAVSLAAGATSCTLATTPLEVRSIREVSSMRVLTKTTQQLEDRYNPGWRTETGKPTAWWSESAKTIRFNRVLDAPYQFTIQILEAPASLGADDNAVIDTRFPPDVQGALRLAAAAYLLQQAGTHQDLKKAAEFMEQFRKELAR